MSKMGSKRSLIIAVLSSVVGLSAVANAAIPLTPSFSVTKPAAPAVAPPFAPKTTAATKSAGTTVTANTLQFSCPTCAASQQPSAAVLQGVTIGQVSSIVKEINLGAGIFDPQTLSQPRHVAFPTATAAYVPAVTSVTPADAQATNDAMMESARFSAPAIMDKDGDIDPDMLGEFMVKNAGISDEYAKLYFGSDAVGTKILKADKYISPFSAASAIDDDDT
jgi:hypothetical protein